MKNINSFIFEKLKLNKDSKIYTNKWVLFRCPLFANKSDIFHEKFNDRKILVWSTQVAGFITLYLNTIDELKKIWGERLNIGGYTNGKIKLFELPKTEDIYLNNDPTKEEIDDFCDAYNRTRRDDWDPKNLIEINIDELK